MNKTNFILYKDYQDHVEMLTDEQAGKLFKAIFKYVDNREEVELDPITKMAFSFIKANLERDLVKYKNIVERNKLNGAKGGRPKTEKTQVVNLGNPKKPKKADIDNDTDIDTDIETKDNIVGVIKYLNEKIGSNYKHTTTDTRSKIKARYNEGFVYEDFIKAIDNAYAHWSKTKDYKNMKPSTLFNGKFESRVNGDSYNWSVEETNDNPYAGVEFK